MASTLSDSSGRAGGGPDLTIGDPPPKPTVFFDGVTNRRHTVTLGFGRELEINEDGRMVVAWAYDDLREIDAKSAILRLKCVTALPLARLEVRDPAAQAEIRARARFLHVEQHTGAHIARIVAWSLAAIVSLAAVVFFGVPFAAERMLPLIPASFERRLGDMADNQVRAIFGGRVCTDSEGNAALSKLVDALRRAGHLDMALQPAVLDTPRPVPNAFALPGGKIYVLNGLLQKAKNADEIAGVIAHEMGHVVHRDQTRLMIENGGTSFLVGLLFGDITGSSAAIFTTRVLFETSYSREAETNADAFAIDAMHALGRSPAPMGELLFRITGAQGNRTIGILTSHPLTEARRTLMRREDRPATGPEVLSAAEWRALQNICRQSSAK